MPTFTTIALETLLEPRLRDSYKNNLNLNQQSPKSVLDEEKEKNKEKEKQNNPNPKPPKANHIYISPALYTTPELTPVTDSSTDSISPSPYVFNRKGRGGKVANHRIDGFEVRQQGSREEESESKGGGDGTGGELQVEEELAVDDFLGTEIVEERIEDSVVDDDFFDLRCESTSVDCSSEMNDLGKQVENLSCLCSQGEFFDANDDFSSDGSISNGTSRVQTLQSLESEMRSTRLSLLDEIEKRKAVEESLALMQSQWQNVSNLLSSQAGLTFPTLQNVNNSMQFEIDDDSIEQLCQEVVVARFVAEAIGKGQARAEAELAAEAIIESKHKEISRLQDRLKYYEAVNHEMCQRNQEVVEIARRQRQRKKVQRRWLWGCIGLSITIGASVIAYTFLPPTSKSHTTLTSGDPPEPPSYVSSSPESA